MDLLPWFVPIKLAHVTLVLASGSLFAARGIGVLSGGRWPMAVPVRRASVVIDTLLLAAGATMWALLALNPLRDGWLGAKLLALPVYIVLGSFALKRGRTTGQRAFFYIAALAVFVYIATVAVRHDPSAGLATLLR
ncbi:MAG: regulator SirB [Rubrivivax sp. SCN 70-15]|nr:MAG: regulator SirB [Rubrivivax sp. SCN 70-15]